MQNSRGWATTKQVFCSVASINRLVQRAESSHARLHERSIPEWTESLVPEPARGHRRDRKRQHPLFWTHYAATISKHASRRDYRDTKGFPDWLGIYPANGLVVALARWLRHFLPERRPRLYLQAKGRSQRAAAPTKTGGPRNGRSRPAWSNGSSRCLWLPTDRRLQRRSKFWPPLVTRS